MSKQMDLLYASEFKNSFKPLCDGWYNIMLGVFRYSDIFNAPYEEVTPNIWVTTDKFNIDNIHMHGSIIDNGYTRNSLYIKNLRVFITDLYDKSVDDHLVYLYADAKPVTHTASGIIIKNIFDRIDLAIFNNEGLSKIKFIFRNSVNGTECCLVYNRNIKTRICEYIYNHTIEILVTLGSVSIAGYCWYLLSSAGDIFLW